MLFSDSKNKLYIGFTSNLEERLIANTKTNKAIGFQ
ncbi:hypothetical protein ACFSJW_00590 [Flavobacterium artemisiae]|uniref:GIY-YIG domain-containing protein n=1 Tax=Flavobacterium artemisiae TaxID=2126556 RepID=A0ABW4HHM3_9FLAO